MWLFVRSSIRSRLPKGRQNPIGTETACPTRTKMIFRVNKETIVNGFYDYLFTNRMN